MVTPFVMLDDSPLQLIEDMAKLLKYFDVCLIQLPPLVMLIYECAKISDNHFKVAFSFEEIIYLFHVMEKKGDDYPLMILAWKRASKWVFGGLPTDFIPWYN